MSEQSAANVELRFGNDEVIDHWIDWNCTLDFRDPLGSFNFTVQPPIELRSAYRELLLPGNLSALRLHDRPQVKNLIVDVIEKGATDTTPHTFEVQTKSVLATPYEGDVDPDIANGFDQQTPVSEVILKALEPYGFDDIKISMSDNVAAMSGRLPGGRQPDVPVDELKEKEIQAKDGEKAYAFAARVFSRLGVVLLVNFKGELLVVKPDYFQTSSYTLVQDSDFSHHGTRVLSSPPPNVHTTNKGLFSHYLLRGKKRHAKKQTRATEPYSFLAVPGAVLPPSAPFQDLAIFELPDNRSNYRPGAAPYKPKFWRDDSAIDQVRCEHKSRMMHGKRASSGYVVTVTVDGIFSESGRIWTYDTVARVVLEDHDIDEEMWIVRTAKSGNKKGGQKTTITLLEKGALVLGKS